MKQVAIIHSNSSLRAILYVAVLAALPTSLFATSFFWDGGGASTLWSDAANWSPDGAPPANNSATAITFAGSNQLLNSEDASNFSLNALTFDSTAGAYSISGGILTFRSFNSVAPVFTQNSASNISLANELTLNTDTTFGGTGTGNLTLTGRLLGSGLINNNSNNTLFIEGGTAAVPSGINYLAVNTGTVQITSNGTTGAVLDLSSGGSTGFSGNSSLFVGDGATLVVDQGSTVTTVATPQIQGSGQMTVSNSSVWTNKFTNNEIRVGYSGGASSLTVDTNSTVTTTGLRLGHNLAGNQGHGSLTVKNGATVTATTLTLDDTTGAAIRVSENGTLNVGAITESQPGTVITLGNGGNFDFGAGNASSTFNGTLQNLAGQTTMGTLTKDGSGTLTLGGASTFTGNTNVNAGRLTYADQTTQSLNQTIASGATVEYSVSPSTTQIQNTTTLAGTGTLLKTGNGTLAFGSGNPGAINWNFGAGALIDVEGGTLTGGSFVKDNWAANLASLNVAAGATFNTFEANVIVDALTGAGIVTSGFPSGGYQTFTVGVNNGSGSFSGVISNSIFAPGSLTKAGTGTQTLTGANTYTGATHVNGGRLTVVDHVLASSAISVASGATWEYNVSNGNSLTNSTATLSGTGTLVKSGPGTLLFGDLSGPLNWNFSTGALIDVEGGTLTGGNFGADSWANNFASLNVASGATFLGVEADVRVDTLTGAGTVNSGFGSSGSLTVGVSNGSGTFSGVIADGQFGPAKLTKTGTGTQILTGANTYTGVTNVNGGTLRLSPGGSITPGVNGIVNVGPGATLDIAGGSLVLGSNGQLLVGTTAGNSTVSTLTISGGSISTKKIDLSNATGSTSSVLQSGGSVTSTSLFVIGVNGDSTYTQSGGTITESGGFLVGGLAGNSSYTITGGTLMGGTSAGLIQVGNGSSGTSVFTQSGTAIVNTNGAAVVLGAFAGGTNTYNLDGGTLTAPQVVAGTSTGTFNFNGGTLEPFTSTTAFFPVGALAQVRNGGAVINTNGFDVTFAQSLLHSTIAGDNATDGGLTKNGLGTLTMTGALTYTGETLVQTGRLVFSDQTPASFAVALTSGGTVEYNVSRSGTTLKQAATGLYGVGTLVKSGPGTLVFGDGSGEIDWFLIQGALIDVEGGTLIGGNLGEDDWELNAASLNVASGATFLGVEADVQVDALTGAGTVNIGYIGNSGSLTLGIANGSGTFSGAIVDGQFGPANLSKVGTGTETLTGANTYTGPTSVAGGRLVFVDHTPTSPTLSVASGAFLEYNVSSSATTLKHAATTLSGAGTLVKSGPGTLAFGDGTTGAVHWNFSAGALIDVEGGTLIGGNFGEDDWTNNLASLNVASGARFQGVEADVRVDALTGAGTVTSGFGSFGSLTLGVANGSGTFTGIIADDPSGPAKLSKVGTGTQTLTGLNTYTGGTQVHAGTLLVNGGAGGTNGGPSGTGSGPVTVDGTGTLGGVGFIGGTVGVHIGGTLSPGNSGPGRLTIRNSLTLASGSTTFIELGGKTASSQYDQAFVSGSLQLGGALDVALVNGFTLTAADINQKFFIFDNISTASTTGSFANAPTTVQSGNDLFNVNYADHDPADLTSGVLNDVSLTFVGIVPEPTTALLLTISSGFFIGFSRRRRS